MEIETASYKRCSVVTVSGRVDSNTAPTFEQTLRGVIDGGQRNLVLELNGVEFMSSAGLRGMVSSLKACKSGGGNLVIANPSNRVSEVMQLAGLTSLFSVYGDVTSAVGSF
jgi:anti-sigma B factor antagonist